MKIIKTASGKQQIKISRKEWETIGKKAGWTKKASLTTISIALAVDIAEKVFSGKLKYLDAVKDFGGDKFMLDVLNHRLDELNDENPSGEDVREIYPHDKIDNENREWPLSGPLA